MQDLNKIQQCKIVDKYVFMFYNNLNRKRSGCQQDKNKFAIFGNKYGKGEE